MSVTLAFDIYGTLIDTHGVVSTLQKMIGSKAHEFSRTWRDKQLEYSFRRGLMQNYENFAVCTKNALDYTCSFYKITLTDPQREQLLERYRVLPAFEDAKDALESAKAAGFHNYAFSNGSTDAVETLLAAAGIREFFMGVVSVDDLRTFKPSPAVYAHFMRKSGAAADSAWMISSNPFDVIGAISAGMKAAWIRRSPEAIFDPWGIEPTLTLDGLRHLSRRISEYRSN